MKRNLFLRVIKMAVFLLMLPFVFDANAQNTDPNFEYHKVSIYSAKIKYPKWIEKVSDEEWRNEYGKLVYKPEVNFAGKYYIAVHSCGTGCRYYTLTDLTTGRDLRALNMFAAGEDRPKTSEGFEYMSILYYRPDSKMLLAQYIVDTGSRGEQCRERAFVLEKSALRPITPTRRQCTKF